MISTFRDEKGKLRAVCPVCQVSTLVVGEAFRRHPLRGPNRCDASGKLLSEFKERKNV